MAVPIDHALKSLSFEFEEAVKLFETKKWKFYKFGLGGPYKRYLTKLTKLSDESDPVITERFGIHGDNCTFEKLITLCLESAKDPITEVQNINAFRNQIKRMRHQI